MSSREQAKESRAKKTEKLQWYCNYFESAQQFGGIEWSYRQKLALQNLVALIDEYSRYPNTENKRILFSSLFKLSVTLPHARQRQSMARGVEADTVYVNLPGYSQGTSTQLTAYEQNTGFKSESSEYFSRRSDISYEKKRQAIFQVLGRMNELLKTLK